MTVEVKATCKHCKTEDIIEVHPRPYAAFMNREFLVQHAFPHLDEAERELLLGHRNGYYVCDRCFVDVFGDEDDDGADDGLCI